jgi:uncharacterized protein (DUF1684 family)
VKRKSLIIAFLLLIIALTACKHPLQDKGTPEYIAKIKEWHNKRIANLKKETGWLNLAGLYWLKQGENKFGSGKNNDIVFPDGKAPGIIGSLFLKDSTVTINVNAAVNVICNGKPVSNPHLINDQQGDPTILEYGSLRWFIIKRGTKYGIRLRDLEAPLVKSFQGVDTYPINSDWRLEAKLESFKPPMKISVPNILGTAEDDTSPGFLVFKKDGIEYKLLAIEEGDKYFLIFADETSGKETYGAGRFLYADKVDSNGITYIDFNKAFNPPCSFTHFATCPLPPKQNHLKLSVTSGEKKYEDESHSY